MTALDAQRGDRLPPLLAYGGAIVALEAVSGFISFITAPSDDPWYQGLAKSALTPPDAVFGIVWPLLYALMAVAAVTVWRSGHVLASRALAFFAVQLALNWAWAFVFFTFRMDDAAVVLLLAIIVAVAWTGILFARIRPLAGLLLLPYGAWLLFALTLSGFIAWNN